jgi:hypothetical protein
LLAINLAETQPSQLHPVIDSLQGKFNALHSQIAETWFLNKLMA